MRNIKNQAGQAFPIGIALFLILGVTSFVLFNSGQAVTNKTRIVNTADSAAYSGLLWQARAMNFTAYTNRAMVANQVAMAQAVSLNSWSGYINKTGENIDNVVGKIPYVGVVTGIIRKIASAIDFFLSPISQGMLSVIDSINSGITIAQESMYLATFAATPDVINSVVGSNDVRNQKYNWQTGYSILNTGLNLHGWSELTDKFDTDHKLAMAERGNIVRGSLDRFSTDRSWKFFNVFVPVNPLVWVRFEKAGTTKLFNDKNNVEWELYAKDALSLRHKVYTLFGRKYFDLPIGGASSLANTLNSDTPISDSEDTFFPGRHSLAKKRGKNSVFNPHDARTMTGYSGIRAYRSLSEKWRSADEPPVLKLSVEVTLDPKEILNAGDLHTNRTGPMHDIGAPGNVLTSVSAAELYFEQPCLIQVCAKTETYADGYSPYWAVRLSRNSNVARLAAYSMHGGTLTDKSRVIDTKLHMLPNYSGPMATPLTDFKEQYKGVKSTLRNMENHLALLEENSPEFAAYKQKLDTIKSNINLGVEDIIDDFVTNNIDEGEIAVAIAEAAGFDFSVAEYEQIKGVVGDIYKGLQDIKSIGDLRGVFEDSVTGALDQIEADLRAALEEKLKNAVKDILAGMVKNYASQYTNSELTDAVISDIAEEAADQALSDIDLGITDKNDIEVDISNECAIFEEVHKAEIQLLKLQALLEEANRKIAVDFHAALVRITSEILAEADALQIEIDELRNEIELGNFEHRVYKGDSYDSEEELVYAMKQDLNQLIEKKENLYKKRFDLLVRELMRISDSHTSKIDEYKNYKLEYKFAAEAVKLTLGDITVLAVDENGEPVTDHLLFSEFEDEQLEDADQTLTERPENCPG